jgi:protein TonB
MIFIMYLLNNTVAPMMAKKGLWGEMLTAEEQPQSMGGLLLTLVLLLHIAGLYLYNSSTSITVAKPEKIMEVSLIAIPLPVADVPPPAPTPPTPPKPPEPPKPVPPKPVIKPKPVVKPKPKPVVKEYKTDPILIPVAKKEPIDPCKSPQTFSRENSAKPVYDPCKPQIVTKQVSVATTAPAQAAPAKVAPPAPAPPVKETVTPAQVGAGYASTPSRYPSIARSRGWEGKVILQVRVSADGEAEQVTVAQSSGHDVLDEAAVDMVEGWRFTPAKRGDTPVSSTVRVPINFKLDN